MLARKMNENILRVIEEKLNSKYYATNRVWLRDCVDYYLSEHGNPKHNEVLEFVISQWLLSDLREISNEAPCLPKNLNREKSTTLQGHFILQMDKLYDISESKFKQIEKIRNVSDDNLRVTEDEKTQGTWQPKKKRMLQLHLTDGAQDVIGIEYKTIGCLDETLLPGYKLLIKGPVICRRGVLLLDELCIEEIGGEVANLLVPNALENVLARALNLTENPDPYRDNDEANCARDDELFQDDFDIDIDIDNAVVIESDENRRTMSATTVNERQNDDLPLEPVQPKTPATAFFSRTESDLVFDEIDDAIFDEAEIMDYDTGSIDIDKTAEPRTLSPSRGKFVNVINDENKQIVDIPTVSESISSVTESSTNSSINVRSNFSATSKMSRLKIDNPALSDDPRSTNIADISSTKPRDNKANKRTAALLSSPESNAPAQKMPCPGSANVPRAKTRDRKITEFMNKSGASSPTRQPSKIYHSVCDLSSAIGANDAVIRKTIKAKVTKFGTLSKSGQFWQLNATLTDNTGSIEATFSSEILESMLGFNVAEFSMKKKQKKSDPSMENYLRQRFRNAERQLSQLDGAMEIELAPNEKPKVIEIKDDAHR